jgi:GNAT superfamily N-acetyltransferase
MEMRAIDPKRSTALVARVAEEFPMLGFVQQTHLIRRAHRGEAALIAHMRRASLWCLDLAGHSTEIISDLLRRVPDFDAELVESGTYFVAERAGDVLGGVGWSPLGEKGAEDDAVMVRGFFVDSEDSRVTIGTRMLAHVEADAARAGFGAAEIVAPASLHGFYRGLGFRTICRLPFVHGDESLPLVHMRKVLSTALPAVA